MPPSSRTIVVHLAPPWSDAVPRSSRGDAVRREGGGFDVPVSRDAAQLLLAVEGDAIRGLALALPAVPSVTVDATSTALGLCCLDPNFATIDPVSLRGRVDAVLSDPAFSGLRTRVERGMPGVDEIAAVLGGITGMDGRPVPLAVPVELLAGVFQPPIPPAATEPMTKLAAVALTVEALARMLTHRQPPEPSPGHDRPPPEDRPILGPGTLPGRKS